MFIELTSIAFGGEHYRIYINSNHIESIRPLENGCKVFMVSDPDNPYIVVEEACDILSSVNGSRGDCPLPFWFDRRTWM